MPRHSLVIAAGDTHFERTLRQWKLDNGATTGNVAAYFMETVVLNE
ncbi:MAG: hypothetical protein U0892_05055 [Pirellulales bacterium]